MKKKRILSLVMSLCILGTSSLLLSTNVSAAQKNSTSDQSISLRVVGGEFTVKYKTPLMTGRGGTGTRSCYLYGGDEVSTISDTPSYGSDGSKWYKIEVEDNGSTGWVASKALR
ncbi:hypothetical protein FDF10_14095 [Clostridium botulinum]|nr:hypothetical protein [Clostridium botulinum]